MVDDEEYFCIAALLGLQRMGHLVDAFHNPKDALTKFLDNRHSYDVIITDYDMPSLSGFQLANLVREKDVNIPILLITGFGSIMDETEVKKYPHLMLAGILQKPFDFRILNNAICIALANRGTHIVA